MKSQSTVWPVIGVAFLVASCASVSVQPTLATAFKKTKPMQIIVSDFTIPKTASIRVDRSGRELSEFENNLTAMLRQNLLKDLWTFGIPVRAIKQNEEEALNQSRRNAWLITGAITRVNQGSRALRVIIGVGAGGTKLETNVRIFDLSVRGSAKSRSISEFKTTGGSNAVPGVVFSAGPGAISSGVSAGVTAILCARDGVTEDTYRTARMIADYVSEELAARGAIPAGRGKKDKHLGENVLPHPTT